MNSRRQPVSSSMGIRRGSPGHNGCCIVKAAQLQTSNWKHVSGHVAFAPCDLPVLKATSLGYRMSPQEIRCCGGKLRRYCGDVNKHVFCLQEQIQCTACGSEGCQLQTLRHRLGFNEDSQQPSGIRHSHVAWLPDMCTEACCSATTLPTLADAAHGPLRMHG
jgi:hypothetical protein